MRSVNIFKSVSPNFPIRVEYWENDKLWRCVEVAGLDNEEVRLIAAFIGGCSI